MSESQEFHNMKAKLEEDSRSLNEERKNLEERLKILEEKIAVEELKKRNAATREVISQLKTRISELEQKLEARVETPAPNQQLQENVSENDTILNPEVPTAQQIEAKKQDERKRRTFF